jgi:hypothetical protein
MQELRCNAPTGKIASLKVRAKVLHDEMQLFWLALVMLFTQMQVGYVMQLTGEQLSAELHELLPDYELAFAGHGETAGPTEDQVNTFAAYYYTNCTQQLNQQFGDMLYKIQDLEASKQPNQNMFLVCSFGDEKCSAPTLLGEMWKMR